MGNLPVIRRYTIRDGLSDLKIETVYADRKEVLWIGTHEQGVCRFNRGEFTTINRQQGLASRSVFSIVGDREGQHWFGTERGIYRYDGTHCELIPGSEKYSFLWGASMDRAGALWFGLDRRPGQPPAVCRWDGNLELIELPGECEPSGGSVHCITSDDTGNVWIGDWHGGIHCYDGNFTSYTVPGDQFGIQGLQWQDDKLWINNFQAMWRWETGKFYRSGAEKLEYEHGHIGLYDDGQGGLWTTTVDGRVIRYSDGYGEEVAHFPHHTSHNACAIAQDNLWVGTVGGGLYCLDSNPRRVILGNPRKAPSRGIRRIVEVGGQFIFATKDGLVAADCEISELQPVIGAAELSTHEILGLWKDDLERLWVSMRGGLVSVYYVEVVSSSWLESDHSKQPQSGRLLRTTGGGSGLPHNLASVLAVWKVERPTYTVMARLLRG